ncbi:cyclin-dependent kinase 11B isoform X2 [Pectinophora gossypiella]|uniref:cyclin-dependent kinase 11B isoform X2 n=1 Tax=Pectinophora gossypiella TaxID=13191 RepID=UPI00214F3B66|nr:cyclin-dependent kinase 11B isoform X2 [Pectinophora gossypiella]
MSNYEDDQSEDGELARSPIQEEMDFSLSDEDRDNADSLVIKPPQAVLRPSHRDKRAHKRSGKDRYKETSRKEKKHMYRDRDNPEKLKREMGRNNDRDEVSKDYYREKQYYREKEVYREKEMYREKDIREKEMYRDREMREKEVYREKDPYREREHYREREAYKDNSSFRDTARPREAYREKEIYKEKDVQRDRDAYLSRERQYKYEERKRLESDRMEPRLRDESHSNSNQNSEKENRDKTSGDKELEDLRSRLLSKRKIELQTQEPKKRSDYSEKHSKQPRQSSLDKQQQERRNRFIEAEREMEKRKNEARTELEARREDRRRRGKKRSTSPATETSNKKGKPYQSPNYGDSVVTLSDASDVEMKSESEKSEPEEGEHSNTETEDESSSSETDSGEESKSDEETTNTKEETKASSETEKDKKVEKTKPKSKSPTPKSEHRTPSSRDSRRSNTRSKSRSRSHSFSPPPPAENGKVAPEEEKTKEDEEQARLREEAINALPPYYPALQGCRSVEEFQCLNRIEEGTYGVVYRARDKTTDEIVALKRLKMEKEKEGFPITSLREINTLLKGQHPNIVTVREIVVGSNMDKIFIVMDYVEHDLKSLMETMRGKKQVFLPGEVKCLMTQLLKAVHHLHDNWILHRDLKTSNLLLSHKGVLKVGDFGLAREYGSPLRQYTPIVVTLWYRAPELLLCGKEYSTPIDMWSVGCIFAEFISMHPLFPGKSEVDQLNRIFKDLGTPSEAVWPGYSELPAVQKMTFAEHPAGGLRTRIGQDLLSETGHALLQGFLTYNPAKRTTADAALEHAYFKEHPVAIDPAMFPTWPAKSEGNRRTTHSPRPPAGGAAYAQFARADSDEALGFHVQHRSLNVAPGFSLKF